MNTTVLLFHPNLAASRINARLAQAARGAGTAENPVEVRDMYALYPDFKVDVAAEQAVCEATDRIVLQFPMYWYSSRPCSSSGRTTSSPTAGPTVPPARPSTARRSPSRYPPGRRPQATTAAERPTTNCTSCCVPSRP